MRRNVSLCFSGDDNFHVIQCRVTNTYAVSIGTRDFYRLYEGATAYTEITIKEGYLNTSDIFFQFRGNSSAQATAVVSYTGTIVK